MDSKGRTSLPARFRDVLMGKHREAGSDEDCQFVLTMGIEKCLVLYSIHDWNALEAKLAELSQFNAAVQRVRRIYVAGATDVSLDRHGRVVLAPMLREYAGIQRDVVWAGMGNVVELWGKERWLEEMESSRAQPEHISKVLTELGL